MEPASYQTGNRPFAAALLRELFAQEDLGPVFQTARDASCVWGEGEPWISRNALTALFVDAGVDPALARRIGRSAMAQPAAGFLLRYGGIGTPEKAYRRCDDLLAREIPDARYVVVRNAEGGSRILFHTGLETSVDEVFCAVRVGMLEAIPTLFGLLPATVEETTCAARGDACCVYEVRHQSTPHSGLAMGSLAGAALGGTVGAIAGVGLGTLGLAVLLGGALAAAAGRGVDLARQLEAVGGSRRGQLAVADYLDSALAEKMDRFARLDAADTHRGGTEALPGVQRFRPEATDFRGLVRRAIEDHRDRLPPELEIDLDLPMEEVELSCDALQIEMLVLALLQSVNAPNGETVRATVHVQPVNEGVELTVEDDGLGLEEERADAVFDPYLGPEHSDGPEEDRGLRAACRIVEDHGGELRVESAPESGNRVTALLRSPGARGGVEGFSEEQPALPLAG